MEDKPTFQDRKLLLILKGSNAGLWDWPDMKRAENYWSPRMYSIMGWEPQQLEPTVDNFFATVLGEDRDRLRAALNAHLEQREPFACEYRIVTSNGDLRWVEGSGHAEWNAQGEPLAMAGMLVDIDQRKKAQQLAEKQLELVRSAELLADIGTVSIDFQTQQVQLSKGAGSIFETEEVSMLGLDSFLDLLHNEDREKFLESAKSRLSSKERVQVAFRLRTGKKVKYLEATFKSVNLSKTHMVNVMVADNTRDVILQADKDLLIKSLERSNEELEQFAYVASHDLQEPLRKIMTFGERLSANASELSSDGATYLTRMNAAAKRMSILIQDLLEFSRLSQVGSITSDVNLGDLFTDIKEDLKLVIEEKNASVQVLSAPQVAGNSGQLYRLFLNLISNSLKFSKEEVPPEVKVTCRTIGKAELKKKGFSNVVSRQYHQIDISDNGIGFEEKYLDRIFVIFQRLNERDKYKGTGIGLAICQKIAVNHGGFISARSTLNEGATFSVFLPFIH